MDISGNSEFLSKKEAALFVKIFNVKEGGNFDDAGPGHHIDQNILHLKKPLSQLSRELGISLNQLRSRLETGREKLFHERLKRIHPVKDDKILSGWNGLIIAVLAKAGYILDNPKYTVTAAKAADFVLQNLADDNQKRTGHRLCLPGVCLQTTYHQRRSNA